jgi:hypothetical protein
MGKGSRVCIKDLSAAAMRSAGVAEPRLLVFTVYDATVYGAHFAEADQFRNEFGVRLRVIARPV